jgi:PAS domain S-box-containing protein
VTLRNEPASYSMFEAALIALDSPIIIHAQHEILFANEAAHRVLRAQSPNALIGNDVTAIVHPDGLEAGHERRKLVLESGQTLRDVPVKLRAIDGTTLYATCEAKRIEWGEDAAILIVATSIQPG